MPTAPRKLLLIGWDSADWKLLLPLMEAGRMPHLSRLVSEGCMGKISTLHPVYSPMLWTSIATGKRPYKHGVLGFSEPLPDGSGVRPVSSLSRRAKAFWNIFHQQGWTGHVVGWWPSHPVEPIRGSMISNHCHRAVGPMDRPWPVPPGGMQPPELVETLAELRFNPQEFVPEMIEPFVPRAKEIDQDKDRRLAGLMRTLAECVTVNNWGQWLVENTSWDYCAVYFDAMDHVGHGFMRYHPPRRPHIPERDFELYSNVMTQAAILHDMMLGALLAKVPADTTIVLLSDHGFHPDDLRPSRLAPIPAGPAEEHSDFGILVVRGPGIRRDALLHGASILDIAPTLLAMQGLPVGKDMDGRPLLGAFVEPPVVEYIPSWEGVQGEDGRHPADLRLDPAAEKAALDQLVALGYVAPPRVDVAEQVRETQRELDYNLAEALMDGGRDAEALPVLRRLHGEWPEEYRFALRRAMCCRSLGRTAELKEIVSDLAQVRRPAAEAARAELRKWRDELKRRQDLRKAETEAASAAPVPEDERVDILAEDPDGPADVLEASPLPTASEPGAQPRQPPPLLTVEERREVRLLQARAALNPFGVEFLQGVVAMAERRPREALEHLRSASKAMARRPGLHIQIGEASQRLGFLAEARTAFEHALELDPQNPHALVGLSRVALGQRRLEEAAGFALRAVQLLHNYPLAHFLLGLALSRLGQTDRAATEWETVLELNPRFFPAHLRLARLRRKSDPDAAAWHLSEAHRMRAEVLERSEPTAEPGEEPALHAPAHVGPPTGADGLPEAGDFAPAVLGLSRPPFEAPVITIVTGLPRSGTSLLMQMLVAGGIAPLTDGQRGADDDNPRGYFEHEAIKALARDASCLDAGVGKVAKVVLPLLGHLPRKFHYHVLFIERDLGEIFASQAAMLRRSGQPGGGAPPETLAPAYERLLRQSRSLLAGHPQMRAMRISHRWLLGHAREGAQAIGAFLGWGLDVDSMAGVVDPRLHRQRSPGVA